MLARVITTSRLAGPLLLVMACSGGASHNGDDTVDAAGSRSDGPVDGSIDGAIADAAPTPPTPGLRATYFRHHGGAPALERVDDTVDFAWGDAAPTPEVGADHFSVRWTGTLDVPAAGTYTFVTNADDGVRLRVGDGAGLLIDDWAFHAVTRDEATITLPAGPIAIALEYFDKDYAAEAHLAWRSDAIAEQIIPRDRLTAAPAGAMTPSPKPPYDNPVIPADCPDPGVLADGGAFYMVCTGGRFRIRRSDDLVLWDDTGAFVLAGSKPPWSANGNRDWAPEIHKVGAQYVAYFTAADGDDHLAIGAASAPSPTGPFTDRGAPLVQDPMGVIDATYFLDAGGHAYLIYKIDGNSQGKPTPIFARELAADGLSFAPGSAPHQLLVNEPATWEGGVIEAPWLVAHGGSYYLFYSGNVYDARYRTGVARASSVLGPYQKRGAPILANNARWVGPGHGSVVTASGGDYFVYHAWSATASGGNDTSKGRQVLVDRIVWNAGWPQIADGTPSTGASTWPSP
jgi:GH43 family beta-xylosidase